MLGSRKESVEPTAARESRTHDRDRDTGPFDPTPVRAIVVYSRVEAMVEPPRVAPFFNPARGLP